MDRSDVLKPGREPVLDASTDPRNLVSVLIPTHNRAAKLRQLLEALARMDIPVGVACEVIVADNGSTDDTAEVCAQFAARFPAGFERIFVALPRKSLAVNAAIQASRGAILAFLDDDLVPTGDWLRTLWQEFSADPSLGGISGRVELQNESDFAAGIRLETERVECKRLGEGFGRFGGGNVAVRREVVARVGPFDPDLGPGSRFSASEDTDFFYRAWKAGAKLVYVPTLSVRHDHGRSSAVDGLRAKRGYAIGRGAFYAKHFLRGDLGALKLVYWEIYGLWRDAWNPHVPINWRHKRWLCAGFLGYVAARLGRALRFWIREESQAGVADVNGEGEGQVSR
jgi:glycosyltransferase involved in cell wall biosynthesis